MVIKMANGAYNGTVVGSQVGSTIDSGSLVGNKVDLIVHPRWYSDDPPQKKRDFTGGWVSVLEFGGVLTPDGKR